MHKELIAALKELLLKKPLPMPSSHIEFLGSGYTPVPLDRKNFQKLPQSGQLKDAVFIDGGNQEVLSAPHLSVQFIRAAAVMFSGIERKKIVRKEFFAVITSEKKDSINFRVRCLPDFLADNFIFKSDDKSLLSCGRRCPISRIGHIIRRIAELKLADEMASVLKAGSSIVLDGTLEAFTINELLFLDKLLKSSSDSGVLVSALAKTTRLYTSTGDSVVTALNAIAPQGTYLYEPAARIENQMHPASLGFLKLHSLSGYLFRFEWARGKILDQDLVYLLKLHSMDPAFLGYPFGLVEADKHARVSGKEKLYHKAILSSKLDFSLAEKALDAHEFVDKVNA